MDDQMQMQVGFHSNRSLSLATGGRTRPQDPLVLIHMILIELCSCATGKELIEDL